LGNTVSSARSISLAASSARSTSPSTSNARQVTLQRNAGGIELALERQELVDVAARQRLETTFTQLDEHALERTQWRQVSLADERGRGKRR
jgi:hypothetical protein